MDAVRVAPERPAALSRYVPILEWLPKYERGWLGSDAVAALSVWALLVEAGDPVTSVVIDAESVQMTDTDGADILIQVGEELKADGTRLALARVHPPILELWRRAGAPEAQNGADVYLTVRDAVAAERP